MQLASGAGVEILSAFSKTTLDADAHAFAALMDHLAETDARDNTVLMVQVENEIGMLPVARERGAVADRAFDGPVPRELMATIVGRGEKLDEARTTRTLEKERGSKPAGTWAQVFGDDEWGQEVFTAWH